MNKLFIVLLLSTTFIGCRKQFEGFTKFSISYSQSTTIESSVGINLPVNIATPPVQTNSESEFKNENTNKDLIDEIFLEELILTITSPNSSDFSFLEKISIYINADGLSEKIVAWKDPVPSSTSNKLTLDTSSGDFQEYIKKDAFSLRVSVVTDEVIAQDHEIEIASVFNVSAKLLD